jgi:hypothetical protein
VTKFDRVRKDTGLREETFATNGTIRTIAPTAKANTNGNLYFTFTADVELPGSKTMLCMGQVYESAFDFLGDKPKVGDELVFAVAMDNLRANNNKVWYILGHVIEEIDEERLEQIESFELF